MKISKWHLLVAPNLALAYEQTERMLEIIKFDRDAYMSMCQELKEKHKRELNKAKNDSAIAVEVIKQRLSNSPVGSILGAREHAATQRILSLERDNIFLLGEVQRMRVILKKFNQK